MFSPRGCTYIGRLTAILAVVCAIDVAVSQAMAQGAFYRASAEEIAGRPGTLIRREYMAGAPLGADTFRVLYRSTGLKGEPIAVSGVTIIPKGRPPPGGRPIVAWGHPTTGIAPRCAPSLAVFLFQQIQGLRDMVEHGYVVTATDYPGLGTPGPHPFLVGTSEGHAVLDSVRSARALAGLADDARVALWGHSQGGQAVLYAALIAKDYAPDVNLVGVAAAAPATDLGTLLRDDLDTAGGKNLLAMTLWSWSRVFDAPIDHVVDPAALPTIDRLAQICLESPIDILPRHAAAQALAKHFLSIDNLTSIEPWHSLLASNMVGIPPSTIPVVLAQGTADTLVTPDVTRSYMQRLCGGGSAVRMLTVPDVGHGMIASDSARIVVDWMSDRFAGKPAPSDCGR